MDYDKEEAVAIKPKDQTQRRENKKLQKQQYPPLQQVPEEPELPMDQANKEDVERIGERNNISQVKNTTHQLRQSRRLPRALENT